MGDRVQARTDRTSLAVESLIEVSFSR